MSLTPLPAVREALAGAAARDHYNTRLIAAGLAPLAASEPIHRDLTGLRRATRFPALALRLDTVTGGRVAAGGLHELAGAAHLLLALAGPDDPTVQAAGERYLDALRAAVELDCRPAFDLLWLAGVAPEGELLASGGLPRRLFRLWFEFRWLYTIGEA